MILLYTIHPQVVSTLNCNKSSSRRLLTISDPAPSGGAYVLINCSCLLCGDMIRTNDHQHYLLLMWITLIKTTLRGHALNIGICYDDMLVFLESLQLRGSSICVAGTVKTLGGSSSMWYSHVTFSLMDSCTAPMKRVHSDVHKGTWYWLLFMDTKCTQHAHVVSSHSGMDPTG